MNTRVLHGKLLYMIYQSTRGGAVSGRKKAFSIYRAERRERIGLSSFEDLHGDVSLFIHKPSGTTGITTMWLEELSGSQGLVTVSRTVAEKLSIFDEKLGSVTLSKEEYDRLWGALWDDAQDTGAPTMYDMHQELVLPNGSKVTVSALSDRKKPSGGFLPDEQKPIQSLKIQTADFTYIRTVENGVVSSESYREPIPKDLPALTEEERERHRYCVIPSRMARPMAEGALTPSGELSSPEPGGNFAVVAADVGGPLTTTSTTYHKTTEEAQAWADRLYQKELYRDRTSSKVTYTHLKRTHDTLRAAIMQRYRDNAVIGNLEEQF
jgi:hypothetical protein